ncbi:MAG TPA: type III pantothenate kinase [Bacteroidota bacterium]|nr:type III pantothenate kinase [Bacteroidota bacterium]
MILVADIGNTNVSVGVWRGGTLVQIKTRRPARADRAWWKKTVWRVCARSGIRPGDLSGSSVSSVVPSATRGLVPLLRGLTGRDPLLVRGGLPLGLGIRYPDPDLLGPDRVCAMLAAGGKYPLPVIVVDCGTAVTFDAVDRRGRHAGGMIAPGLAAAASSLARSTAALPRLRWKMPARPAGHSTRDAIRSGVYYAVVGAVRENVSQLKKVVGKKAVVVGTGGGAAALAAAGRLFDIIDPALVLEGAMRAFRKLPPGPPARVAGIRKSTASRRGGRR